MSKVIQAEIPSLLQFMDFCESAASGSDSNSQC